MKIDAIVKALGDIAGKYGYDSIYDENYGKCDVAAKEMAAYLKRKKEKGAIVTLRWTPGDFFIWSNIANKAVGNNGYHVGVLYKGKIYCNVHPCGLDENTWIDDFVMGPPNIKEPPSYAAF